MHGRHLTAIWVIAAFPLSRDPVRHVGPPESGTRSGTCLAAVNVYGCDTVSATWGGPLNHNFGALCSLGPPESASPPHPPPPPFTPPLPLSSEPHSGFETHHQAQWQEIRGAKQWKHLTFPTSGRLPAGPLCPIATYSMWISSRWESRPNRIKTAC